MDASAERRERKRPTIGADASTPGPARLYALLAGGLLALLGVLGFFYDAEFGTGQNLASDHLAGLLNVNGWRNVIYLATGVIGLALASRWPRRVAAALGLFYLLFALWGFNQTERGIGDLLGAIPLGDNDNALHLVLGILGLGAALVDGPRPKLPERLRPRKPRSPKSKARSRGGRGRAKDEPAKPAGQKATSAVDTVIGERGSRGRSRAGPRRGDAS